MITATATRAYSPDNPYRPETLQFREFEFLPWKNTEIEIERRRNGRPAIESYHDQKNRVWVLRVGALLPEADQWEDARENAEHLGDGYGWA